MKHLISTTLLLINVLSYSLTAQEISSKTYSNNYIKEDFNKSVEHFELATTNDNYFILDKGDYLLSRNNNESEYTIIAENSNVSDFVLKTSIRIGPSDNKKASIGIVLKAQKEQNGTIIFEINKLAEYRIKQFINNEYQILSGNTKQKGWVRSKLLNKVDKHNSIEIRSENNIYDVYLNSKYLTTFFVPEFNNGACGIIISPQTKARVSYFYINIKGEENNLVTDYIDNTTQNLNNTIEELNKKIKSLEQKNSNLNQINIDANENQKEKIVKLNSKNTNLVTLTAKKEKEIKKLNVTITDLKTDASKTIDLESKNTLLNIKVKKLNSQLNNSQSKNIKFEKAITNNAEKIKSLNTFRDKTINLTAENKKLKNKVSALKKQNAIQKSLNSNLQNKTNKSEDELMTLKTIQAKNDDVTGNLNDEITSMDITISQLMNELDSVHVRNTTLQLSNDELKELFILKDFELNGVKPSEMIKETSNIIHEDKVFDNKTIYSVQLGVYMKKQTEKSMKNIEHVWCKSTDHGTYIYYSGEFNSVQEATSHINTLITEGYTNNFVVTINK